MKGDFSRNPLQNGKGYSGVLMQQGRVVTDRDSNLLQNIINCHLRDLAADIIGPHGGPEPHAGFEIKMCEGGKDFEIGFGHYYVDGILVENEPWVCCGVQADPVPVTYYTQPYYADCCRHHTLDRFPLLVYLDVWERHVTYIQDPDIREVALGGPDTTTRTQVVWQVKTYPLGKAGYGKKGDKAGQAGELKCADIPWDELVAKWQPKNRGCLKARTRKPDKTSDPCITPPDAGYRGAENQLYRVEIHKPGLAGEATFKVSRDNGSIVFPIRSLLGDRAVLEHLGRDAAKGLQVGDWVEIVDDEYELCGEPGPLLQVEVVDRVETTVVLAVPDGVDLPVYDGDSAKHPFLRRWDHRAGDPTLGEPQIAAGGALTLEEDKWLALEYGFKVCFEGSPAEAHRYRAGDYWMIPARTATGDVVWPKHLDNAGNLVPTASPPHGVEHHFAPLAVVNAGQDDDELSIVDCRCTFPQLCAEAGSFRIRRIAFYDHDYLYVRDLEDPGEIPKIDPPRTGIAVMAVEFDRKFNPATIVAGAEANDDPEDFSLLIRNEDGEHVPGKVRFDEPGEVEFKSGHGLVFDNRAIFGAGKYTVTLFGDEEEGKPHPAIRAKDGARLDGEPDGLPSGDGQEGGNFTFQFEILG